MIYCLLLTGSSFTVKHPNMKLPVTTVFTHLLLLVSLTASAQAPLPAATAVMETNHVKAFLSADGTAFAGPAGEGFVPVEPGLAMKSLMGQTGLWIAGMDPAGNLKGAVSVKGQTDFHPGLNPLFDPADSIYLNHIWKVSCADINQHLDNLQNGILDSPVPNVFGFPGRGNPYFAAYNPYDLPFTIQGLGGFYDRDGDAGYDPLQGDYPSIEIRGCSLENYPEEQNWFVFNDVGNHPSLLQPLEMEIQTQFFAFKTPSASPLNNAIFARYKLINRGAEQLDSCYFGLYADFNIGNPDDDFLGTIPGQQVLYGYNGDNNDEGGFGSGVPVMAIDLMRGPLDTFGMEVSLHSAVIVNDVDNLQPVQYYHLLSGSLQDGSPAPNGGIMFPDNPNDPNGVSEYAQGNAPGKRVGVASYGPFSLKPGAVNELIVAYYYVYTPGATPLQNVEQLYADAGLIQGLFDNCFEGLDNTCDALVNAPDYPDAAVFSVFPNPANTELNITSEAAAFSRIEIFDTPGRIIRTIELARPVNNYTLPVSELPAGAYLLRVNSRALPLMIQR